MKSGFTLVEVLVSVFVLSVGMLGLMACFLYGSRAAEHDRRISEATGYARQIVEAIRIKNVAQTPPPGLVDASPADRTALDSPPLDGSNGLPALPSNTDYSRNIQISPYTGTSLAQIAVHVYWTSAGSERSVLLTSLHGN